MLDELEQAAKAVLASVGPLVVQIGRGGRGSGLVVGPNLVLTNAHNLGDGTTPGPPPGAAATQGSATGVDIDGDWAIVQVDPGEAGAALVPAEPSALAWRAEPIEPG